MGELVILTYHSIASRSNRSISGRETDLLGYSISCSILFEGKIAELYERLSLKLPSTLAEILLHVARESRNHAEFFSFLAKTLGVDRNRCEGNKFLTVLDGFLEKAEREELSIGDVREILSECAGLERAVGEEYHVKLLSQLISSNLKMVSRRLPGARGWRIILEEISVEETYHAGLIEYVTGKL